MKALPEMRPDSARLVRQAVSESCRAYVLVTNCAEGWAPLKVQALAEALSAK